MTVRFGRLYKYNKDFIIVRSKVVFILPTVEMY